MRNTKKAISILLTLLMVVGMMSTFAFATTTTGSITIENPQEKAKYTAYKVFDLTYSGTNYSYTINSETSEWYPAIKAYQTGKGEANDLTLTKIEGTTTYIVGFSGTSTADLAKSLKTWYENNKTTLTDGKEFLDNGTKKTVTGLELGYYFVNSTAGTLCMLNSTDPTADIYDKNEGSDFGKTATKINNVKVTNATTGNTVPAKIGDVISYEITVKVPSTQGYVKQEYVVSDKMSTGLTYDSSSISFKIDGTEIDVADAITDMPAGDKTFKYKIDMTKLQTYVGKTIKITYTAKVNSSAVDKNTNTAGLQKNDPAGSVVSEPDSTVTVTTGEIKVIKFEAGNDAKTLPGAKFVLKNGSGTDAKYYKAYKLESDAYVALNEITENTKVDKVEWVNEAEATVLTTNASGNVYFKGLAATTEGTDYYLVETEAPEGYNMLKDSVKVTVKAGTSTTVVTPEEARVANSTGTELPSTGGIGTTIFYLIGAILVIGAGVVFVTRRRMHSDK